MRTLVRTVALLASTLSPSPTPSVRSTVEERHPGASLSQPWTSVTVPRARSASAKALAVVGSSSGQSATSPMTVAAMNGARMHATTSRTRLLAGPRPGPVDEWEWLTPDG